MFYEYLWLLRRDLGYNLYANAYEEYALEMEYSYDWISGKTSFFWAGKVRNYFLFLWSKNLKFYLI